MIRLEVGKKYIDGLGREVVVNYVGKDKIVYKMTGNEYESIESKDYAQANLKEMPKEPKKLGQLYMWAGDDYIYGDLKCLSPDNTDTRNCIPVAINENGEVFERIDK
jgi:hypothetical protein